MIFDFFWQKNKVSLIKINILFLSLFFQHSCVSTDHTSSASDDISNQKSDRGFSSLNNSEIDLKLAKLWARVDELEQNQARSKEKIRILEKGFLLGLVPEELKEPDKQGIAQADDTSKVEPPRDHHKSKNSSDSFKKDDVVRELSPQELDEYQKAIATAHEHFRAGKYGRAILEYTELGNRFGDSAEGGAHHFWIARSWYALKEYEASKKEFLNFIERYSRSPWVVRAKLELAKVDWQLGLRDTALKRLRDIIEKHPTDDTAEMARMELERFERVL